MIQTIKGKSMDVTVRRVSMNMRSYAVLTIAEYNNRFFWYTSVFTPGHGRASPLVATIYAESMRGAEKAGYRNILDYLSKHDDVYSIGLAKMVEKREIELDQHMLFERGVE